MRTRKPLKIWSQRRAGQMLLSASIEAECWLRSLRRACDEREWAEDWQGAPKVLSQLTEAIRAALQSLRAYAELPLTEKDKAWIDSAWEQYKASAQSTITE